MQALPNSNQEVSQALSAVYTLIEGLRNDNTQLKLTAGTLHAKVITMEEQSSKMGKIVVEGNGQRPLTTRMVIVEDAIVNSQRDSKEHHAYIKSEFVSIHNKLNELEDRSGNQAKATLGFGLDITKTLIPMAIAAIVSLAFSGFFASFVDKQATDKNNVQQTEIENNKKLTEENRALLERLKTEGGVPQK